MFKMFQTFLFIGTKFQALQLFIMLGTFKLMRFMCQRDPIVEKYIQFDLTDFFQGLTFKATSKEIGMFKLNLQSQIEYLPFLNLLMASKQTLIPIPYDPAQPQIKLKDDSIGIAGVFLMQGKTYNFARGQLFLKDNINLFARFEYSQPTKTLKFKDFVTERTFDFPQIYIRDFFASDFAGNWREEGRNILLEPSDKSISKTDGWRNAPDL